MAVGELGSRDSGVGVWGGGDGAGVEGASRLREIRLYRTNILVWWRAARRTWPTYVSLSASSSALKLRVLSILSF